MNDDTTDAGPGTELMTPVEILESATVGCIEMLRRRRVCLYPGPHIPARPGDLSDFWECLPFLGNCNALIFCACHHGKEEARAKIKYFVRGGNFDLLLHHDECVGVDDDWVFNWRHDLLFPQKSENLLLAPPKLNAEPQPTRPPDSQFWAHYVVLSIVGREEKLHLLYLGLRGDYAWVYFLSPHGIRVSRLIAIP
jgi:hypothetical protein